MTNTYAGDDDRDAKVDARVKRALDAPPEVVSRTISAALQERAAKPWPSRRIPRPLLAAAASLLVAIAAIVALTWRHAPEPRAASSGVMTNEGDIIVIQMSDRPITLIGPGAQKSPAPPGTMSIVLLGEPQ